MATTYEPIATTTLGGAAANVTFSSISGTFTDLVLVINAATDGAHAFLNVQLNSDTGTNYSYTELLGNGTTAISGRSSNANQMFNANLALQQTTISYNATMHVLNYSNTTTYKTILLRANNTGSDYPGAQAQVGLWRNTAAITSIKLFSSRGGTSYNFSSGSTFTLYGIKAA